MIVDNRPGASANIGMELVAKAPADGYTLLMSSNGIATNNALFPTLAFDGLRDFAPVARIGYAPLVVVVPASSPAKSMKDLIATVRLVGPGSTGQDAHGDHPAAQRRDEQGESRDRKNKLADLEVLVTPGTPEKFAAFIKSQTDLWSGVVKSSGIKPN